MPDPAAVAEAGTLASRAGKYLVFRLGGESYGIAVLQVREIIRMTAVTAIPQTPDHIRGVINLRGKIIPVVDLRVRFGLSSVEDDGRTCILVVQAGPRLVGAVVDWVEEVTAISGGEIEEPPAFGAAPRSEFVLGIAKTKAGVRILLDVERAVGAGVPEEAA